MQNSTSGNGEFAQCRYGSAAAATAVCVGLLIAACADLSVADPSPRRPQTRSQDLLAYSPAGVALAANQGTAPPLLAPRAGLPTTNSTIGGHSTRPVIRAATLLPPAGQGQAAGGFTVKPALNPPPGRDGAPIFAALEVGPHGTVFTGEGALLEIAYDAAVLEDLGGLDPIFLQVGTYDAAADRWQPLKIARHDLTTGTITARVPHLSLFALILPFIAPKPTTSEWNGKSWGPMPIPPVLLVHGYQAAQKNAAGPFPNATEWTYDQQSKLSDTFAAFGEPNAPNLPSVFQQIPRYRMIYWTVNDIESCACELKFAIGKVLAAHPDQKVVRLITHSMGGLVSRAYIQGKAKYAKQSGEVANDEFPSSIGLSTDGACPYAKDIDSLLTLGTPHGGAAVGAAAALVDTSAKEMYPLSLFSPFLAELNSEIPGDLEGAGPDYWALWGDKDAVVHPFCTALGTGMTAGCFYWNIGGICLFNLLGKCRNAGSILDNLNLPPAGMKFAAANIYEAKLPGCDHTGKLFPGVAKLTGQYHPAFCTVCSFLGACDEFCQPTDCLGYCCNQACGVDFYGKQCGTCAADHICDAGGKCVLPGFCGDGVCDGPTESAKNCCPDCACAPGSVCNALSNPPSCKQSPVGKPICAKCNSPADCESGDCAAYTSLTVAKFCWPAGKCGGGAPPCQSSFDCTTGLYCAPKKYPGCLGTDAKMTFDSCGNVLTSAKCPAPTICYDGVCIEKPTCGDGKCAVGEDALTCCSDCACAVGLTCTGGTCAPTLGKSLCAPCILGESCAKGECSGYAGASLKAIGNFCSPAGTCKADTDCPSGWLCNPAHECWIQTHGECQGDTLVTKDNCGHTLDLFTKVCGAQQDCTPSGCTPKPLCGDGLCDKDETCLSCPGDCACADATDSGVSEIDAGPALDSAAEVDAAPILDIVGDAEVVMGDTAKSSCVGNCGGKAPAGCYCDSVCQGMGDCCGDFAVACPAAAADTNVETLTPDVTAEVDVASPVDAADVPDVKPADVAKASCVGNCGYSGAGCSCDTGCEKSGDCCADFVAVCKTPPSDSAGDGKSPDAADVATPNDAEVKTDSPSADAEKGSCVGKCGDEAIDCWCDAACVKNGDCCGDFDVVCPQADTDAVGYDEVCAPECSGKQCGPDGCDGICGECDIDSVCDADQQCVPSVPRVLDAIAVDETTDAGVDQGTDANANVPSEIAFPVSSVPSQTAGSTSSAPRSGCNVQTTRTGAVGTVSSLLVLIGIWAARRKPRTARATCARLP